MGAKFKHNLLCEDDDEGQNVEDDEDEDDYEDDYDEDREDYDDDTVGHVSIDHCLENDWDPFPDFRNSVPIRELGTGAIFSASITLLQTKKKSIQYLESYVELPLDSDSF